MSFRLIYIQDISKKSIQSQIYCNIYFILKFIKGIDDLLSSDIKPFYRAKRVLELAFMPYFLHDFWRKIFMTLFFISPFVPNAPFLYSLKTPKNVKNFKINLSFVIKPFFYITKTSGQKNKYSKRNRGFNMK